MTLVRLLTLALLLGSMPLQAATADEEFDDYREIFAMLGERHADAVVTVKFVMSVTNSGNEQRIEDRTQAVLVGEDGLLLVPERTISLDLGTLGNRLPAWTSGPSAAPLQLPAYTAERHAAALTTGDLQ